MAIAEGIESDEQLESMRELGCDLAQGFLFARPVPPGQLRDAGRAQRWRPPPRPPPPLADLAEREPFYHAGVEQIAAANEETQEAWNGVLFDRFVQYRDLS